MIETKCYFENKDNLLKIEDVKIIGSKGLSLALGNKKDIITFLKLNNIENYYFEVLSNNSKMPLLDYSLLDVRVEPGAIIRDKVILEKGSIVLMNAVINVGSVIGSYTMIDMGAVIGSGVKIGANCHIGANAVIAGVLEPPSKKGVVIEDNVFIGANSVVLEGVTIGENSIIGAMTLVNKDIPKNSLVMGIPCTIKPLKDQTKEKCKLNEELRR